MTKNMRLLAGVVEILAGWCGFLGVGHLLSGILEGRFGRVLKGLLLMVGWWLTVAILVGITAATGGLAVLCTGPALLFVPFISGILLM